MKISNFRNVAGLLALTVSLVAQPVMAESAAGSDNPEYAKARELYSSSNYDAAIEVLGGLLEENPGNVNYLILTGEAYGKAAKEASGLSAMGLAKKSKSYLAKAVEADPNNPSALYPLIVYLTDAPSIVGGDTDEAEILVERLKGIDPELGAQAESYLEENG